MKHLQRPSLPKSRGVAVPGGRRQPRPLPTLITSQMLWWKRRRCPMVKAALVRDTGSGEPGSRPLFGSGSGSSSLFLPSEWYLSSSNPIQLKPNQYFRCLRSWPVTTHAMGQTSVREARVIGIFKKISASGVPSLVAVVVPSVTNTSVSTN